MKVAYVFSTTNSFAILYNMIIPQVLEGRHGADVVGMFFLMDNAYFLLKGTEMGEDLKKIHDQHGTLVMGCDVCCLQRNIAEKLFDGAEMGCFPNFYAAMAEKGPDQVITL